jgi:hypothetical protein
MSFRHFAFALYVLILLVFFGCAAPPRPHATHYRVEIDPAFPDYATPSALDAVQQWRDAAPGLTIDVVVSRCSLAPEAICLRAADNLSEHAGKIGWTDEDPSQDAAEIVVLATHRTVEMTKLIAHELGHGIGLLHTGPGTVMCGDVECSADAVTCRDVEQFWATRPASLRFAACPCGVASARP